MLSKNLSKNYYLTLMSTTLFISTYYLILPALPIHMQLMGTSKFVIGLIMGLFSFSSLIFRPLAGQASDRKGPVKIMKLSIIVFFITPLFYFIDSIVLIGIVQLIYGFTIGAFTISSATVITISVPTNHLTSAIGIHSISLILAKGLAPTFGSYLYTFGGIRLLITTTVFLAIMAIYLTILIEDIPPLNNNKNKFNIASILSQRLVLLPSLVLLTITLTFGLIMSMLPLLALERGIKDFNLFFLINTLAVVITRLITGKQNRINDEGIIVISLVMVSTAVIIIANINTLFSLLTAAFIYGLGYGASYPALSTIVVLNTPLDIRGSAFGLYTAFFDVGVTLGALLGGLSEFYGFKTVFIFSSLIPMLGLLVLLVFYPHKQNIINIFNK